MALACIRHWRVVAGHISVVEGYDANPGICYLQGSAESSECPTRPNCLALVTIRMQLMTCKHAVGNVYNTASITLWNAQNERSKWICITAALAPCSVTHVIRATTQQISGSEKGGLPCHRSTSGC